MKMNVYIDRNDRNEVVEANSIKEIANKLKINLEEFIIVRNDELITENTKLKEKDKIKFFSVISGG